MFLSWYLKIKHEPLSFQLNHQISIRNENIYVLYELKTFIVLLKNAYYLLFLPCDDSLSTSYGNLFILFYFLWKIQLMQVGFNACNLFWFVLYFPLDF